VYIFQNKFREEFDRKFAVLLRRRVLSIKAQTQTHVDNGPGIENEAQQEKEGSIHPQEAQKAQEVQETQGAQVVHTCQFGKTPTPPPAPAPPKNIANTSTQTNECIEMKVFRRKVDFKKSISGIPTIEVSSAINKTKRNIVGEAVV
jgi:hypothetical protein